MYSMLYLAFLGQLFAASIESAITQNNNNNQTYKAGVVEFNVRINMTGQQRMNENTKRVIDIINSDETKNVDILVFPESILNDPTAPVPLSKSDEGYSLCDSLTIHWVLHNISCAARKSATYIVIDLVIKDYFGDLFNTALVFDRKGSIIQKYRKYHLFGESMITRLPKPDITTFKTDFNVTFGVFICFDIFFEKPAMDLVNKGIKNFVFPSKWYSELPFLTALQAYHGWAYANNVNLLSANVNCPATGNSGSAIFSGRSGALTKTCSVEPRTQILIADVPINLPRNPVNITDKNELPRKAIPKQERSLHVPDIKFKREDLSGFEFQFLKKSYSSADEIAVEFGSDEKYCQLRYVLLDLGEKSDEPSYFYAFVHHNSRRIHGGATNAKTGQKICSIISCTKQNDPTSCGIKFPSSTKVHQRFQFTAISFEFMVPVCCSKIMPNTLLMDLQPTENFTFNKTEIENTAMFRIQMNSTEAFSDLMTFGIYVRNYRNDNFDSNATPMLNSNAHSIFASFTTVLILVLVGLL